MDPITLITAFATALGILGADAALHSDTVNVKIAIPSEIAKSFPNDEVVEEMFLAGMEEIIETKSYFGTPSVKSKHAKTIGSVLAHALKVDDFAQAIQHQFGMKVASVTGSFANDGGKLHLFAVVTDIDEPPFTLVYRREADEPIRDMLMKAALGTMEHLTPYLCAVYLLNEGDHSHNYQKPDELIQKMLRQYASSTKKKERASALNLAGISSLHKNDMVGADQYFVAANEADPELVIPQLNRAFIKLITDHELDALAILEPAIAALQTKRDYTLMAAAEMTRAAAYLALNHRDYASIALSNAVYWDPTSAAVYSMMADLEHGRGDGKAEAALRAKARDNLDNFETYPELASLYYRLSWKKGEPLTKNEMVASAH